MSDKAPRGTQEIRILRLMRENFPELLEDYLERLYEFRKKGCPSLLWENTDDPRFFKHNLKIPSINVLSEPLSRFREYKRVSVPISSIGQYHAPQGLIPCYSFNLNIMTCLKLWGSQAEDFFTPYAEPFRGEELAYYRFDPDRIRPPQFSSMNFILKNRGRLNSISAEMEKIVLKYFKYAFWSFPKSGFSCSPHIIHTNERIRRIFKVAKSLYVIKKIDRPRQEELSPGNWIWVQRVQLEVPGTKNTNRFWTYVAKDVIDKIEEEREGSRNLLINGLIYELKDRHHRYPDPGLRLLSVVSDFIPGEYEIYTTLLGLCAERNYRFSNNVFSDIGDVKSLHRAVESSYRRHTRNVQFSDSFFSRLGRPLDHIIDELHPILIVHDERVFFIPPSVISALLQLDLDYLILEKDNDIFWDIMRFLNRIGMPMTQSELNNLHRSEYFTPFKELDVIYEDFWDAMYSAFCTILLSKKYRDCF